MKEFNFESCFEIKELLGKRADNELKLLELIEEVPADSIYYHTHSYFLRHRYIAGAYPNDFATWAAIQLRDRLLGEKLAAITSSGDSIEDIRLKIVETLDSHICELKTIPSIVIGEPFYFMQSKIIRVPTGISAKNLKEFIEALEVVDASVIYNHIYEARLRDKKNMSDFSHWIDEVLGLNSLAKQIEKLDCYMYSLEGLRKQLLDLCKKNFKNGK